MTKNRLIIYTIVFSLLIVIAWVFCYFFGHILVKVIHETGFFSKVIAGKEMRTLPYCLERFDILIMETLAYTGASIILFSYLLLFMYLCQDKIRGFIASAEKHPFLFIIGLSIAVMLILAMRSVLITDPDIPIGGDPYAYWFQAKTFLHGRLWNPVHPKPEFFKASYIIAKNDKWVSKYAPGWPFVLAAGMLVKIPGWLVNPILGALLLLALFYLSKRLYGTRIAIIFALATPCSSLFISVTTLFGSQALSTLLIVLSVLCVILFDAKQKKRFLVLCGLCIGFAFNTRYYTAFWFAILVALYLIAKYRSRSIKMISMMAIGFAPFFFFFVAYNYMITGHCFLTPHIWNNPDDTPVFLWGNTIPTAISFSLLRPVGFMQESSPILLILYLFLLIKQKGHFLIDYLFIFLLAGHMFFIVSPQGAKYVYEAYPFVVLSVVSKLYVSPKRYPALKTLFIIGLCISCALIPGRLINERVVRCERLDLYRLVKNKKISNAVVFIDTNGTSVRAHTPCFNLTHNGVDFTQSVIYAIDLGIKNSELKQYFPDKRFYFYRRDLGEAKGTLEKGKL